MCLAVAVMLLWHLFAVAMGETAVEGHDHDAYRQMARGRGDTFVNSYDLGYVPRRKLRSSLLFLIPSLFTDTRRIYYYSLTSETDDSASFFLSKNIV